MSECMGLPACASDTEGPREVEHIVVCFTLLQLGLPPGERKPRKQSDRRFHIESPTRRGGASLQVHTCVGCGGCDLRQELTTSRLFLDVRIATGIFPPQGASAGEREPNFPLEGKRAAGSRGSTIEKSIILFKTCGCRRQPRLPPAHLPRNPEWKRAPPSRRPRPRGESLVAQQGLLMLALMGLI